METLKSLFIVSVALLAAACATEPPIPVTVDSGTPAVAEAEGSRAVLRVLRASEISQQFGGRAAELLGVVELKLANRGASPVSLERKQIRMVSPAGKKFEAWIPFDIAKVAHYAPPPANVGNNALGLLQVFVALGSLSKAQQIAATWEPLMPETFNVAVGEERRMLLAFQTPDWAPGLWRLELPLTAANGAIGPRLSVPITFRVPAWTPD